MSATVPASPRRSFTLTRRHFTQAAFGSAALATLAACDNNAGTASSTAAAEEETTVGFGNYSSKQPYIAPTADQLAAYSDAPEGYTVTYTEAVARHGSRGLSSYKYDALLILMAQTAAEEDGFVSDEVKEQFLADLDAMVAANVSIGYGQITGLGKTQHQEIGARAFARNPELFDGERKISFQSSGSPRATESGENFLLGLDEAAGGTLESVIGEVEVNTETLYFHKTETPDDEDKPEGTAEFERAKAYEDYVEEQFEDGTIAAAMDYIEEMPDSQQVTQDLLSGIFTEEFISKIGTEGYTWFNTEDGSEDGAEHCAPGADTETDPKACGKTSKSIEDAVTAALYLYNLYIISAGMSAENTGEHSFDFAAYFEGHEEDAAWFSYLLDSEDFYEKGPSLEGHDETYIVAEPLLEDFFTSIDDAIAANDTAATFRFGHAETIVPFSALLELPGSTQHAPDVDAPASDDDVYTYDNNEWRGETVTPMAANVQWDVATKEGETPLVRMLLNEVEIPFNDACTPVEDGSNWYKLTELKRALLGESTDEEATI